MNIDELIELFPPITTDLAHRLERAGLGCARAYLAEQVANDLGQTA